MLGDAVVEDALAADGAALLGVEGGRVVLEILDQRTRLRTLIEDLGLAFVDLAATDHFLRFTPAGGWEARAIGEERGACKAALLTSRSAHSMSDALGVLGIAGPRGVALDPVKHLHAL